MERTWSKIVLGVVWIAFSLLIPLGEAKERLRLSFDTPGHTLIQLNPAEVDLSLLPLDTIAQLGVTGVPPSDFQVEEWRLVVRGSKVAKPESFTYQELLEMPMMKKRALLVCPGFFADYAECEGIPLKEILQRVQVTGEYGVISFAALDGYTVRFSQEEVETHFLLLALKVNGETLPLEHGFPVRLVAEDFFGSRWVKWISTVTVDQPARFPQRVRGVPCF
ncbi:MAG: molybdopterin-dependent oxidoreductase [Candidatus Caldatribacteriaceae bacterium]